MSVTPLRQNKRQDLTQKYDRQLLGKPGVIQDTRPNPFLASFIYPPVMVTSENGQNLASG
jgi:hypothetical protein